MAKAQDVIYAFVGVGDFALEKAKGARKFADRDATTQLLNDFVGRGKSVATKVKRSQSTKQAIQQTKAARSQVKAAATSVTKAVRANARATKSAANKAAKAS